MKHITSSLRAPAIMSFLLVLPFMILEFMFNVATRINVLDFTVLFGLLWLLPTAFLLILMPIVRNVRAGTNLMLHPVGLLLRVALLALIAWAWGALVIDQLPCFLGVPNCD